MTIVNVSDLDAQMGRQIDPNSVPTHIGGDQGSMEAVIVRGSEARAVHQGAGRDGAAVFSLAEVGGDNYFGSKTVISINEAPPLPEKFEPQTKPLIPVLKPVAMPILRPAGAPPMAASLAAVLAKRPVVVPAAAPAPVVAPKPAVPIPPPLSAANLDMIRRMGLIKKP